MAKNDYQIGEYLSLLKTDNLAGNKAITMLARRVADGRVGEIGIDKKPKRGSKNLVTSGGVYEALYGFTVQKRFLSGGGRTGDEESPTGGGSSLGSNLTAGYIPKYTSDGELANSLIKETSGTINVAGSLTVGGTNVLAQLGGKALSSLVTSPTSTQNGYSVVWDNTSSVFTLSDVSGGSSSTGEANTASNVGTGEGIFQSKLDVDLQFKSLTAGSNISYTASSTEISIAVLQGSGSGLDADTLDTYDSTAFPRKAEVATITGAWSYSGGLNVTTNPLVLSNAIYLQGKSSVGTARNIIGVNASDNTIIGNTAQPSVLYSNTNPTYYNGSNTYTLWHSGNHGEGSGLHADILGSEFIDDLNLDWDTSINRKIKFHSYGNTALNKPSSVNNANWLMDLHSHVVNYGHQISGDDAGDMYHRKVSAGAFGSWRRLLTTADEGSGNGLDADTVDGLDSTAFVLKAGDTMTGSLNVKGTLKGKAFVHENTTSHGYIAAPEGAYYQTTTSSLTGAIKIALPTAAYNQNDMMSFVVDIYDYTTDESITLLIRGYNYSTSGWLNTTVTTLSKRTDKDFAVRFGQDTSRNCVWIGELASTWSYPQIQVRDFTSGYTTNIDNYSSGWNISFVTAFDTVDYVQNNNYPAASDSFKLGGYAALDYPRRDVAETISGAWSFGSSVRLTSTTNALRLNNVSTTNRDALAAAGGDFLFNSTQTKLNYFDGTAWQVVASEAYVNSAVAANTDADTLDGLDSSAFARKALTNTFTKSQEISNSSSSAYLSVTGAGSGESSIDLTNLDGLCTLSMSSTINKGGGLEFNGSSLTSVSGATDGYLALYRLKDGTRYWTAQNHYNSNDWEFRGNITINGNVTATGTSSDFVKKEGDIMTGRLDVNVSSTNSWIIRGTSSGLTNHSGIWFGTNDEGRLYLRDSAGNIGVNLGPESAFTNNLSGHLSVGGDITSGGNRVTTTVDLAKVADNNVITKIANHTFVNEDKGKIIECDGSITLSIPTGITSEWNCTIVNIGTGIVTISNVLGVTLSGKGTKLASQWGKARLYNDTLDSFRIFGDLT